MPGLIGLALLTGAGCVATPASPPPNEAPTVSVPQVEEPSSAVASAASSDIPTLRRDSLARYAKRLTLRVRNIECVSGATGSGFGLTDGLLITNRHVLAQAVSLEVDTWDGRSLNVDGAAVGFFGDLGVVHVNGRLPEAADFGPPPTRGDAVMAVGYPLGGPLTLSRGVVLGHAYDPELDINALRVTVHVEHGNSGGPLLDSQGRVVGIVYKLEVRTGYGLAIPVKTMLNLVRLGGLTSVPPCGFQ